MFTIIRLLYDAVLTIALSVVVAILCGSIAGVIVGASGPNLPVSAIAFLLTGAVLLFRLWRNSVAIRSHQPSEESNMTRRTLFALFFTTTILVLLAGVAMILRGYVDPWVLTVTSISLVAVMGNLFVVSTTYGL